MLFMVLPHHLLSQGVHQLARCRWVWLKNGLIRFLLHRYPINLTEALEPDPTHYPTLNSFFTRALRLEARPIVKDSTALLSPVDAQVFQQGTFLDGILPQAKGHTFTLEALVGGDRWLTETFREGSMTTLYLSPKDYHRIHMPIEGALEKMIYVPGRLFSVASLFVENLPGLFARNERLVLSFSTVQGPMLLVMVGAIFVGSMTTRWSGSISPYPPRNLTQWQGSELTGSSLEVAQGEEIGQFNMGSTVILVTARTVTWQTALGQPVQVGNRLGVVI